MSGEQAERDARLTQETRAGRDAYTAGRDQTIVSVAIGAEQPPTTGAEESTPSHGVSASGPPAAASVNMPVVTGDHAYVDARTIVLGEGDIPRPQDVTITSRMNNLPRPPVKVFVGRNAAMAQLARALAGRRAAVVTQVVHGLGGVGKSELALHYSRAYRRRYQLVWWITSENKSHIEAGLAALAFRLSPEIALSFTTGDAAAWAIAWLQSHERWLLILDNAENPEHLWPLLGQLESGRLIITTRRDIGWHERASCVRLDVLDSESAAQLIVRTTTGLRTIVPELR